MYAYRLSKTDRSVEKVLQDQTGDTKQRGCELAQRQRVGQGKKQRQRIVEMPMERFQDPGDSWTLSAGLGSLGHRFLKIDLYTSPIVNLKPCLYASSHLLVLSTQPCWVVPGGMSSQTGFPGELITMSP